MQPNTILCLIMSSSIHSSDRDDDDCTSSGQQQLPPQVYCGKDFISHFEKALQFPFSNKSAAAKSGTGHATQQQQPPQSQCTGGIRKSRSEFRTIDSGTVGKRRKKKQVRKTFALRPSKLIIGTTTVTADVNSRQSIRAEQEHFSFENCSKELESIMLDKTGGPSVKAAAAAAAVRPRSSSLPNKTVATAAASAAAAKVLPNQGCSACNRLHRRRTNPPPPPEVAAAAAAFNLKSHRKVFKKCESKKSKSCSSSSVSNSLSTSGGGGGSHYPTPPPPHSAGVKRKQQAESTCAQQARQDVTNDIDRLTDYLEESILLPKKMSYMAEMMYT